MAPTREMLELTRAEMGLKRPLIVQYGSWLTHLAQGDMGTSLRSGNPVVKELQKALPKTMAQRVAMAIAMNNGPALLLADEPTSSLDVTVQHQVRELRNKEEDPWSRRLLRNSGLKRPRITAISSMMN